MMTATDIAKLFLDLNVGVDHVKLVRDWGSKQVWFQLGQSRFANEDKVIVIEKTVDAEDVLTVEGVYDAAQRFLTP